MRPENGPGTRLEHVSENPRSEGGNTSPTLVEGGGGSCPYRSRAYLEAMILLGRRLEMGEIEEARYVVRARVASRVAVEEGWLDLAEALDDLVEVRS